MTLHRERKVECSVGTQENYPPYQAKPSLKSRSALAKQLSVALPFHCSVESVSEIYSLVSKPHRRFLEVVWVLW